MVRLTRVGLACVALAVAGLVVGAMYVTPSSADRGQDIYDNMTQIPADQTVSLTTIVKAINASGLAGTLKGKGPFTFFAPTDSAFDKLPAGTWDTVMNDQAKLKQFLLGLVVRGSLAPGSLSNGQKLQTLAGTTLVYKRASTVGQPAISDGTKDAAVIRSNPTQASNGMLWILGAVPGL